MTPSSAADRDDNEIDIDIDIDTSRNASNRLLAVLHTGSWRPAAWVRFVALSVQRSVYQARRHPRAFAEVTVIHIGFGMLTTRRGLPWVATSWLMAVTHLGMLEARSSLGLPNVLTIIRGLLPSIDHRLGRIIPVLSLITDLVDGKLARATGAVTSFGTQADFLADTAFWTWFIGKYEPSRAIKVLTACAWVAPVAGVAIASVARGRLLEIPRSMWFRPAAAMEVFIGARLILRYFSSARSRSGRRSRASLRRQGR